MAVLLGLTSGCVSVSYTETGGGGSGQDASFCIVVTGNDSAAGTRIDNQCDSEVHFIEFSTGSVGLLEIPANSVITRPETITAWGACIAPSIPRRTGDFDYYCEEP